QGAPAPLMVLGQLQIGLRDRLGLRGHPRHVLARNHHVELVLAEVGIDAVADASGARDDTSSDGGRQRHARGPPEEWRGRRNAGAQRGFLEQHHATGPARDEDDVGFNGSVGKRGGDHDAGCLGQSRNSPNLFHLEIAELGHQSERLAELAGALGGQGNVVRVAADWAVVVIGRNRVERSLRGGQTPEAAARGFRSAELGHAERWSRSEGDSYGSPLQAKGACELPLDRAIVDGTVGHGVFSLRDSTGYRDYTSARLEKT